MCAYIFYNTNMILDMKQIGIIVWEIILLSVWICGTFNAAQVSSAHGFIHSTLTEAKGNVLFHSTVNQCTTFSSSASRFCSTEQLSSTVVTSNISSSPGHPPPASWDSASCWEFLETPPWASSNQTGNTCPVWARLWCWILPCQTWSACSPCPWGFMLFCTAGPSARWPVSS